MTQKTGALQGSKYLCAVANTGEMFALVNAGLTTTESSAVEEILGYVTNGDGTAVTVASPRSTTTWEGQIILPVLDWQVLQFIQGAIAGSEVVSKPSAPLTKQIGAGGTPNVIQDPLLIGPTNTDVLCTIMGYSATLNQDGGFFTVLASPGTPSLTEVVHDTSAGTLTFYSAYGTDPNGMIATVSVLQSGASLPTLGGTSQNAISSFQLFGKLTVSDSATADGFDIFIPNFTLSGDKEISYGTGADNPTTVNITATAVTPYQSAVLYLLPPAP